MAACELKGELKYRDGERRTFSVKAENNLKSIIGSVNKLNTEISEVLTTLVEQEKCLADNGKGASPVEDEEEDDSDEQEDAKQMPAVKSNSGGPPAKRLKALKP